MWPRRSYEDQPLPISPPLMSGELCSIPWTSCQCFVLAELKLTRGPLFMLLSLLTAPFIPLLAQLTPTYSVTHPVSFHNQLSMTSLAR
jgi:hypothetical protein